MPKRSGQRLENQEKGAPEITGRDEKREESLYLKASKLQPLKVQKTIKNSQKVSKLNKQAHATSYKADKTDPKNLLGLSSWQSQDLLEQRPSERR